MRALVTQVEPAEVDESGWYLQRAVELFNQSEFPRRVAGVSRSLGAAEISVRAAEHLESVVLIVVAWELCWYRYEVDLSVEGAQATVLAQGTELSELSRDERLVNAVASDSGELSSSLFRGAPLFPAGSGVTSARR